MRVRKVASVNNNAGVHKVANVHEVASVCKVASVRRLERKKNSERRQFKEASFEFPGWVRFSCFSWQSSVTFYNCTGFFNV